MTGHTSDREMAPLDLAFILYASSGTFLEIPNKINLIICGFLPLGGRRLYITYQNRLHMPKLHIKEVPQTSEISLVRPKMDIETSCLQ